MFPRQNRSIPRRASGLQSHIQRVLLVGGLLAGGIAAEPAVTPIWILHYDPAIAEVARESYRDLLSALPRRTRIVVPIARASDAAAFRQLVGATRRPVDHVVTTEALSGWARDRYVFFHRNGDPIALLPRRDSVDGFWSGDLAVPPLLAAHFPGFSVVQSTLAFEGGNILLTSRVVLVGRDAILQNLDHFRQNADAVINEFEDAFGRPVVVVGEGLRTAPHEHIDMVLSVADSRTVLLGDPQLALPFFDAAGPGPHELCGINRFSRQAQVEQIGVYRKIARELATARFRVLRIPIVHSDDGEHVLTWNNVVLDKSGGGRTAYVPTYGLPQLDHAAHQCWRRLGFRVVPIHAAGIIGHGGSVRCLTNRVR